MLGPQDFPEHGHPNDATVYEVVTNEYVPWDTMVTRHLLTRRLPIPSCELSCKKSIIFVTFLIVRNKYSSFRNIFNSQALLDYANTNGELVDLPTSEYSTKSYIQPE